jgi:hypothetical protein
VIYKKCHKSFIKRKFQVVFCSSGDDGSQYLLETGSPSGTLSLSTLSRETTETTSNPTRGKEPLLRESDKKRA